jgi:acyl phosphate:glycerol-3-phosphate acyltransferase
VPEPISWGLAWPYYLAVLAFGYLLGSIPFGLIITRMAGHGDIRKIGSGNIGTTNVLRTGSKKLAALTLLGDALKGTVAVVLIDHLYGLEPALIAGFGAFLGHLYPVWLKFKGGKGVATYLGILLGIIWPAGIGFALIWIAMAAAFRFSSLSALTASLATPIVLFIMGQHQMAEMFGLLTLMLWLKHHENIKRLLTGQETKIGHKAEPAGPPPGSPA